MFCHNQESVVGQTSNILSFWTLCKIETFRPQNICGRKVKELKYISYFNLSLIFISMMTVPNAFFRFSWLLTESNKSGVVDGLKDVYK